MVKPDCGRAGAMWSGFSFYGWSDVGALQMQACREPDRLIAPIRQLSPLTTAGRSLDSSTAVDVSADRQTAA
ncbi:hypothetical protein AC629_13215 [Bradyrhizobium sp. NAS80.1]|uniref:hypothetical protein n=1 Tax=Bradyrhizobium sp. NAS80.1 TaxID=1680159 RepID=UPI0009676DAC|nr:hypothetical protein [Bradyrhizobium sp. NAS80.1]OKO87624.1 hypothetical protein AC629_13215 [Bradyrhizobium sp. NAS80.1]